MTNNTNNIYYNNIVSKRKLNKQMLWTVQIYLLISKILGIKVQQKSVGQQN